MASYQGHLEVVRLLLEKGADTEAPGQDQATALHVASDQGHLEVVQLLLDTPSHRLAWRSLSATGSALCCSVLLCAVYRYVSSELCQKSHRHSSSERELWNSRVPCS
mmetsp:Transcript_34986/g.77147  ORF Transcript_34986/g.77147 Transcript_34986/m.77147 type:complete len:107 (-) Transcript_34986:16-336(-)